MKLKLGLLWACLFAYTAEAQTLSRLCFNTNSDPQSCQNANAANPYPVTIISGGGSGANIGATGAAVPASANYNGINVAGTLRGQTGLSLGSTFSVTTAIVDASGNQITTFGTAWANTNKVIPWDGTTNTTVKAASTAALQADTALVVRNSDLGTSADSVCATAAGTCTLIALQKYNNSTNPILGASSAIIGNVGIDQTTVGTTNAVSLKYLNTTAVDQNSGVKSNGTLRVVLATDQPTMSNAQPVTPAATEVHLGEVGGNLFPITNSMTTSNATVTTGQSIGGIQTLANAVRVSGSLGASGTSGIIQSVVVTFQDAVTVPNSADIYFYNATVTTGSNCQNATTFVLQTADRPNVLGIAHVTDFTSSNTAVVGQAQNLALPFALASSTSLFACVVARGSFAITGTTNASIKVNILRN